MLSGLAQSTVMHFYRSSQTRDAIAAFFREPVTPSAGERPRRELLLKHASRGILGSSRVQIQIIADVGPVIQRLHYGRWTACHFEFATNSIQEFQSIGNPLLFRG
jgi:hypothetical protein